MNPSNTWKVKLEAASFLTSKSLARQCDCDVECFPSEIFSLLRAFSSPLLLKSFPHTLDWLKANVSQENH